MTKLYEPAPGWSSPPAGQCRPGMVELTNYLVAQYGADNLGCYANRPQTSGSSPSLHRDGRAIDIGFAGKLDAREDAYEWLIEHADALDVQMVLNYRSGNYGGTRWRLPYKVGGSSGRGSWRKAGHWLHVERLNAGADNATPIAELVGGAPPPPPPPPPTSELVTVNVSLPTLSTSKDNSTVAVKQCQTLVNLKDNKRLAVDGDYGPKTEKAITSYQATRLLAVDGWVGGETWESLIEGGL